MNRSNVIVGVALGAIVLLVGILLRSGNEPSDDEVLDAATFVFVWFVDWRLRQRRPLLHDPEPRTASY